MTLPLLSTSDLGLGQTGVLRTDVLLPPGLCSGRFLHPQCLLHICSCQVLPVCSPFRMPPWGTLPPSILWNLLHDLFWWVSGAEFSLGQVIWRPLCQSVSFFRARAVLCSVLHPTKSQNNAQLRSTRYLQYGVGCRAAERAHFLKWPQDGSRDRASGRRRGPKFLASSQGPKS